MGPCAINSHRSRRRPARRCPCSPITRFPGTALSHPRITVREGSLTFPCSQRQCGNTERLSTMASHSRRSRTRRAGKRYCHSLPRHDMWSRQLGITGHLSIPLTLDHTPPLIESMLPLQKSRHPPMLLFVADPWHTFSRWQLGIRGRLSPM
ncbi:hypothetical protein OG21DRAFT_575277 [Imleria badia]|nr:hypothetical protein OG21DRAFT_575277 [Imleria badia]